MERNEWLYPISEEWFNEAVLPIIQASHRGKGRPPKVSHYKAFCGILYILRTGCPWRDLPEEYGYWHVVYDRFSRGNERGLWAKILWELKKGAGIKFNVRGVSTCVYRPGKGGRRMGSEGKGEQARD
jgi:transposase